MLGVFGLGLPVVARGIGGFVAAFALPVVLWMPTMRSRSALTDAGAIGAAVVLALAFWLAIGMGCDALGINHVARQVADVVAGLVLAGGALRLRVGAPVAV